MATVGTTLLWSGFNLGPDQTHFLSFNVSFPSRIRAFYPRPFLINLETNAIGLLEIVNLRYAVSKNGYKIFLGVHNVGGMIINYDLWQGWINP